MLRNVSSLPFRLPPQPPHGLRFPGAAERERRETEDVAEEVAELPGFFVLGSWFVGAAAPSERGIY